MVKSIIWNISNGEQFPLELWKHHNFSIQIYNISIDRIQSIKLEEESLNIIFLQIDEAGWNKIQGDFIRDFETNPYSNLVLVSSTDGKLLQPNRQGNFLILEPPLRQRELKWIIEKTLLSEISKRSSIEIGQGCLQNIGFFEGLFELAKKENIDKAETIMAMEKVLEFEREMKKNQIRMNKALDHVNEMRNSEMMELHQRIKATEKLDELRENELREALKIKEATEKALEYSRIEEVHQDKIIKAQEKLFEYTDKEIRELLEENKELKKRLGISTSE